MRTPSEDEVVGIYRERFGLADTARNDVEVIGSGHGAMAVKADTLEYGTDVPPGMTMRQAARKAAVACVSDFAAKGVRPRWAVVSVTAPPSYGVRTHRSMAGGLADAAGEFGFSIMGGDTNRGDRMSLTVCMMGTVDGPIPPRAAAPGDVVYASGPFGLSAAGLHAALHGLRGPRGSRGAVMNPRVRLEFGIRAARRCTASMDSSDGLSTTLNEMAVQSGAAFVVDGNPAASGVREFAARHGLESDDLVYNGGEEYEIVLALHPAAVPELLRTARETRTPLTYVGYVEEGDGAYLERDGRVRLPDGGWKAF